MDRLNMPAMMPAELAEKLSDQWYEAQDVISAQTDSRLDDQVSEAIRREWSMGEFFSPDDYTYWAARFRKALDEAMTYQDPIRYAELGRIVHQIARESVREE